MHISIILKYEDKIRLIMKNNNNKIINSWCMYDWANSAFATTVMAAVLPIFFRRVGMASVSAVHQGFATAMWGYTSAVTMLIVAVLSLILGPSADLFPRKKKFLGSFLITGVISTFLLGITGQGQWLIISLLFIIGSTGFSGSEIFYDSILPHIADKSTLNKVSTRGYAAGYIGGGILLLINVLMIAKMPMQSVGQDNTLVPVLAMRLSFVSVAVWWALFSIPLFKNVPEPDIVNFARTDKNLIENSISQLKQTFKEIKQYKQIFRFLIAFWIYNDGIGTVIKMATAFGDEIGIKTIDLVGALLLTQAVAAPFTILFGKIADRIGTKKSILITLSVYSGISVSAFFMHTAVHFYALAFTVGIVQGGAQALSRSFFGSIIPREKSSEFFTFYHISGKFAGVAGPAIFGLVSQITGSGRAGILSLVLFFTAGAFVLSCVKEPEKTVLTAEK